MLCVQVDELFKTEGNDGNLIFYTLNTKSRQSHVDIRGAHECLLKSYFKLDDAEGPISEGGYFKALDQPPKGIDVAARKALKYVRLVYRGALLSVTCAHLWVCGFVLGKPKSLGTCSATCTQESCTG